MGFLKSIGRAAKRVARTAITKAAVGVVKSTPIGAAAFRVGVAAKQLGAKVVAGREAKRQGRALTAAVTSLANSKRPGILSTPSNRSGDQWIREATDVDLQTSGSTPGRSGTRKKQTRSSGTPKRSLTQAQALKLYANGDLARESKWYKQFQRDDLQPEDARLLAKQKKGKAKRSTSTRQKRALPPAMQKRAEHMKKLAAKWRAAGKPGKWIDYVKANPA